MKPAVSNAVLPLRSSSLDVASSQRRATRLSIVLAYLSLTKPRVVGLVLFTAVATSFAAAEGVPPWSALVLLLTSGFLASGGAAALNQYLERDIDGGMRRTSKRPLVTGQISHPEAVLIAGTGMIATGIVLAAAFNTMLAAFQLSGAFVYVGVYTLWLKRRSVLNIVIGGLAGSFAVLGGWVAVTPSLDITPVLLALLVFLWTPAHFWSLAVVRSADYRQSGVPMLPVVVRPKIANRWILVHVLWTVGLSMWLQPIGSFGVLYLSIALGAGVVFLWMGVRLLRRPGPAVAWSLFKFSGAYLGLLFLAVLIDSVLGAM